MFGFRLCFTRILSYFYCCFQSIIEESIRLTLTINFFQYITPRFGVLKSLSSILDEIFLQQLNPLL